MKNTNQQTEGGTDMAGLQDFLIDVNTEGIEDNHSEVEIDLGKQTTDEEDFKVDAPKEKETTEEDVKVDETTKAPTEVDTTKEEPTKVAQKDSYYANLASKFLEKGKWQDAEIVLEDESVVKLSELKDIDEELFFQIEESQSKFSEDDIKTNYIKRGDFDEGKLKMIEILKEGGDITDIFKTPEEAKRPFEGVNAEDEQVQRAVFYNYLTQIQKFNPEDAKVVLANHAKRGELEGKVSEIIGKYQSEYDTKLDTKLAELKQTNIANQEKEKAFSKSLQDIYKAYNLDEKLVKRFSTLGSKKTESGEFELDSLYSEKMDKPEEAADLIFFLTDKEGYLKSKMVNTRIATQKENLKTINIMASKQRKDDKGTVKPNDAKSQFVIDVPNS